MIVKYKINIRTFLLTHYSINLIIKNYLSKSYFSINLTISEKWFFNRLINSHIFIDIDIYKRQENDKKSYFNKSENLILYFT